MAKYPNIFDRHEPKQNHPENMKKKNKFHGHSISGLGDDTRRDLLYTHSLDTMQASKVQKYILGFTCLSVCLNSEADQTLAASLNKLQSFYTNLPNLTSYKKLTIPDETCTFPSRYSD